MSQYNDTGFLPEKSGAAIDQHLRVKYDADGNVVVAGAERSIGTNRHAVHAAGEDATVVLANKQGTRKMVASAAIEAGEEVFGSTNGRVSPTQAAGSFAEGIARHDAESGEVVEVISMTGSVAGT
jgi:hypothetical protein